MFQPQRGDGDYCTLLSPLRGFDVPNGVVPRAYALGYGLPPLSGLMPIGNPRRWTQTLRRSSTG